MEELSPQDIQRPTLQARGPFDDLLRRLERFELPAGIALVAGGFLAILFGWLDASSTADVRIQMQDLISGGFAGLALVVLGSVLVYAHVSGRSTAGVRDRLERLADAVEALAEATAGGGRRGAASASLAAELDVVVASHASFHAPGCDLVATRSATERLAPDEASARGLTPCRVCLRPA